MCRLHLFVLDSHLVTLWERNRPFGFLPVMFPLGSSYFVSCVCVSFPLMSLMGGMGQLYRFLIIAFPSILTPFSRSHDGLSAPHLLNEWMDFYQTCTAILLRHGKERIRFWLP